LRIELTIRNPVKTYKIKIKKGAAPYVPHRAVNPCSVDEEGEYSISACHGKSFGSSSGLITRPVLQWLNRPLQDCLDGPLVLNSHQIRLAELGSQSIGKLVC
jgi:hypothetical protein